MKAEYLDGGRTSRPTSATQVVPRGNFRTYDSSASYGAFFAPNFHVSAIPTAAIVHRKRHNAAAAAIDEFQALDDNWDGYDAARISDAACVAARAFLNSLPSGLESPELSPNPSGTISMDWQSSHGAAQLELGKSKFSFYLRRRGGKTLYHQGDMSMAYSITALLSMLYVEPRPAAVNIISI